MSIVVMVLARLKDEDDSDDVCGDVTVSSTPPAMIPRASAPGAASAGSTFTLHMVLTPNKIATTMGDKVFLSAADASSGFNAERLREEVLFGMLLLVLGAVIPIPNACTDEDPRMQQRDERTNDNFIWCISCMNTQLGETVIR